MMEVLTGSRFRSVTVTSSPAVTHSTGPGYWNAWLPWVYDHMAMLLASGMAIEPVRAVSWKLDVPPGASSVAGPWFSVHSMVELWAGTWATLDPVMGTRDAAVTRTRPTGIHRHRLRSAVVISRLAWLSGWGG